MLTLVIGQYNDLQHSVHLTIRYGSTDIFVHLTIRYELEVQIFVKPCYDRMLPAIEENDHDTCETPIKYKNQVSELKKN